MATAQSQTAVRDVEQQPASADEFIHYDHIGHGSTPAAWTLSIILITGSVVAGVGFIGLYWSDAWWIAIWIGAACVPLALIMGIVLKKAGYGVEMDSDAVLKQGADPRAHSGPATPDNTSGGAQKREPSQS
ncbi:HGxxPAAW family protein [Nesterenkonia ebinurensis]|uniref:HGxxPAAW family protein n=1 Tax=Nesterenkonia ebinurensis TaxID=2608252 RepID=UPI00123E0233|nr:HGxxPAAW family protein [Nesterenkonia ebinurensis]